MAAARGDFRALLKQRAASAEGTRKKMLDALDRFEAGELTSLPEGSKLTVRSLAAEAGVSKDTPASRYAKGHPQAGQYRFPEVVGRFNKLKKRLNGPQKVEVKQKEVQRLRGRVKELEQSLLLSARANNLLDAEAVELRRRNRELEEDNARLREENASVRRGSVKLLTAVKPRG